MIFRPADQARNLMLADHEVAEDDGILKVLRGGARAGDDIGQIVGKALEKADSFQSAGARLWVVEHQRVLHRVGAGRWIGRSEGRARTNATKHGLSYTKSVQSIAQS